MVWLREDSGGFEFGVPTFRLMDVSNQGVERDPFERLALGDH